LEALALYRAASDARSAAAIYGGDSKQAARAFEALMTTIDAHSDDQGGWGYRRVASGNDGKRRTAALQAAPPISEQNERGGPIQDAAG
jgi:hypothetical protein